MLEYEKQGITKTQYQNIHSWLSKNKTRNGVCEDCGNNTKTQFALIKGLRYEKKPENYSEKCISCHCKYDQTKERNEKISKTLTGRPSLNKKPIVLSVIGIDFLYPSITHASTNTGILITSMANVLAGRAKTCGGGYSVRYATEKEIKELLEEPVLCTL